MKVRDIRSKNWTWFSNEIIDRYGKQLGPYGIAIYATLARIAENSTQHCHPSVKKLAAKLNIGQNKTREVLHQLAHLGLIKIVENFTEDGDQTSNDYILLDLPTEEDVPPEQENPAPPEGGQVLPNTESINTKFGQYSMNNTEDTKVSSCAQSRKKTFPSKAIPLDGPWPSVAALVDLYNEKTPEELPAVSFPISEGRQKKAREYLRQFPAKEYWETTFQFIHASPFLKGHRPTNGHGSFRADFDWLLSKGKDQTENVVKVHDGRYR